VVIRLSGVCFDVTACRTGAGNPVCRTASWPRSADPLTAKGMLISLNAVESAAWSITDNAAEGRDLLLLKEFAGNAEFAKRPCGNLRGQSG